jgi:CRISPR/Cas system-associated exonuclease Cas4 (RecB family)
MANQTIERKQVNGQRFYEVKEGLKVLGLFPSITTVLSATSDKSGLLEWRKKVGEEEADRISYLSMNRGTVMHRLIELYKATKGSPEERLEALKELAKEDNEVNQFQHEESGQLWLDDGWIMFMKFWYNHSQFFDRVKKVLAAEQFLWSVKGGGYAGTVDNVSEMVDGSILIVDYKNSRKPKREDWIEDYYIQASAYYIAYWERTGIKPNGVEIWIANEKQHIPQIFKLTEKDVKYYFKEFTKRLETFKEESNI